MLGVFLDFPNSPEIPWHSGCIHLLLASEMFPAGRSHPYSCCSPTAGDAQIQRSSIPPESRVLPLPQDEVPGESPWGLTLGFLQNVQADDVQGGMMQGA